MNDLISRTALINHLRNVWGNEQTVDADSVIMAIDEFPTANQWIPCSERLPEDLQEVEITFVNHDPASYYSELKDVHQTGFAVFLDWTWYWWTPTTVGFLAEYQNAPNFELDENLEVIAWKPMSEPYKNKRTINI